MATTATGLALATEAVKAFIAYPGLNIEPKVPANTAAAATAGCTPEERSKGIKIAPAAAADPAALVRVLLIKNVTKVAAGINKGPAFCTGLAIKWIKC